MLKNAPALTIEGVDTAENGLSKVRQSFRTKFVATQVPEAPAEQPERALVEGHGRAQAPQGAGDGEDVLREGRRPRCFLHGGGDPEYVGRWANR